LWSHKSFFNARLSARNRALKIKPGFFTTIAGLIYLIWATILTQLPYPYAYRINLNGTHTFCPMAPFSTVVMGFFCLNFLMLILLLFCSFRKKTPKDFEPEKANNENIDTEEVILESGTYKNADIKIFNNSGEKCQLYIDLLLNEYREEAL